MSKKIIIAIVGVVLVGGAGAAYVAMNSNSSATNNDQRRITEKNTQPEMGRFSASTTPSTIDDLQVGEEITVIGSNNTDGSMTAQTILIGSIDFEPGQLGGGRGADGEGSGNGQAPGDFANRQPREGFTPPEGFSSEELQNLTQEERQARFADRESGGFPEGGFGGGGRQGGSPGGGARLPDGQGFSGGNMVRGEILDIDDTAITVALPDGGSRLVLYSSQTTIAKVSEPEI